MHESVLFVDVQKGFCPKGSLPVPNGDEVVQPLNELGKHSRSNNWTLIASRDWHPADATKHFKTWGAHCVQGTDGAEFHPDLKMEGVIVFSKGMNPEEDSYSAFDGINEQGETLGDFLRRSGITDIHVGGLATDYCVQASVLSAIAQGFNTTLLTDAIRAVDVKPGDGIRAIEKMRLSGAKITTVKELIGAKRN